VLRTAPRIGVLSADVSSRVRGAGGEPVPLVLPEAHPNGGVALVREWVADSLEISCAYERPDALLLITGEPPERLAGMLIAALRLNLPTVAAPTDFEPDPFSIVPYALGFAPLREDPAGTAVTVAQSGEPLPAELIDNFSLANALRAGCALDGGPETIVHIAALAREAGVAGFSQMLRVLVPETPAVTGVRTAWYLEHRSGGLLAHLGETLNDTKSVTGGLKGELPEAPSPPDRTRSRLLFVRGRASGAEALCRMEDARKEVAGVCRVFDSDEAAAQAVEEGLDEEALPVVVGYGPRGGPGLLRPDLLAQALRGSGLEARTPVMTDGLPPRETRGTWISLFSPEAAAGGVIGRLRDGDTLRIDLAEARILTGVGADELEDRDAYEFPDPAGAGYAARYARSALPALEGAGIA
jgi:dihydroxy-acid dehydratase